MKIFHWKFRASGGFTLIETMVVLGIFMVVTTIVFVGNDRFNNTILLTNLAYDVALTVSRAQSYGINVKQLDSGSFETGYGVHFTRSDNFSFVLFADKNFNKNYDSGELLERYVIRRGNKISKLWADSSSNQTNELNVVFIRPYPDAYFNCSNCLNATRVGIEVTSPAGLKKNITIESTGQISVQ